jgi:hypothetical protein
LSETLSVSIDAAKGDVRPTLEEEAAKLDAAPVVPQDGDRPAWLPEKFKQGEDLAKAYEELEKKLGSKKDETDPKDGDDETDDEPQPGDQTEARKVADEATKKAGLDLNSLSTKYLQNGALDDADYSALEKAGYPKELVKQFEQGQEAILAQRTTAVYDSVGGEEAYSAMIAWAGESLSPAEVTAFNKTVNGTDMGSIMFAIRGLKAQYDGSVGFEPSATVRGQTVPKTSQASYSSIAQLEKDMGDPRYQNDPAFRKEVETKLGRSDIF